MKVYNGESANNIGNEKAEKYGFVNCHYFECERRFNPAETNEMSKLYNSELEQKSAGFLASCVERLRTDKYRAVGHPRLLERAF